jgi:hypothetical protein
VGGRVEAMTTQMLLVILIALLLAIGIWADSMWED